MFEENYTEVGLSDIEIYYLAKELKLSRTIGLSIDYSSLNKELKNDNYQICYDFFKENHILDMDFSGNVVVAEKYKSIISTFENPDYCCIIHHRKYKENAGAMRKIYRSGKDWTALDYFEQEKSAVYKFDNFDDANKFMFTTAEISPSDIADNDKTIYKAEEYEEFSKDATQTVVVTEYVKDKNKYNVVQSLYIEMNNNWFVLEFTENSFTKHPVRKMIEIKKCEV